MGGAKDFVKDVGSFVANPVVGVHKYFLDQAKSALTPKIPNISGTTTAEKEATISTEKKMADAGELERLQALYLSNASNTSILTTSRGLNTAPATTRKTLLGQ